MKIVTIEAALDALLTHTKPVTEEIMIPRDEAKGYVLSQDVKLSYDMPPYDRSPYDGYAIGEPLEEGLLYHIIGHIGAGEVWHSPLEAGQAIAIMTGAAIPQGTYAVVMKEVVLVEAAQLRIKQVPPKHSNFIDRGEECKEGAVILKKGTLITSEVMAVLAGTGTQQVTVYQPLKIAVVTTGRELVDPDQALSFGKIHNSNGTLYSQLLDSVGKVSVYHISDNPKEYREHRELMLSLLEEEDVIISTGGVSVGDYDEMPKLYEELKVHTLYEKLSMRPGAASYGGVYEVGGHQCVVLGLSGNPTASYHGYQLLARPLLRHLRGLHEVHHQWLPAELAHPVVKSAAIDRYVQGHLKVERGHVYFEAQEQSSSGLLSLATAKVLAHLPRKEGMYEAGDWIDYITID